GPVARSHWIRVAAGEVTIAAFESARRNERARAGYEDRRCDCHRAEQDDAAPAPTRPPGLKPKCRHVASPGCVPQPVFELPQLPHESFTSDIDIPLRNVGGKASGRNTRSTATSATGSGPSAS